jgi:hypothetical protein
MQPLIQLPTDFERDGVVVQTYLFRNISAELSLQDLVPQSSRCTHCCWCCETSYFLAVGACNILSSAFLRLWHRKIERIVDSEDFLVVPTNTRQAVVVVVVVVVVVSKHTFSRCFPE